MTFLTQKKRIYFLFQHGRSKAERASMWKKIRGKNIIKKNNKQQGPLEASEASDYKMPSAISTWFSGKVWENIYSGHDFFIDRKYA